MPETVERVGSVVLNPQFTYHDDVEILKRFVERLSALADDEHLGSEVVSYVRTNIQHARAAVSELLADDVERQIQITKDFPLQRSFFATFHDFAPYEPAPEMCEECDQRRGHRLHTL